MGLCDAICSAASICETGSSSTLAWSLPVQHGSAESMRGSLEDRCKHVERRPQVDEVREDHQVKDPERKLTQRRPVDEA